MEKLLESGKIKSIGLSNFTIKQTQDILNICKYKPVLNTFEVNPFFRNEKLVEFCQKNDIAVVAYASLRSTDYFTKET